MSLALRITQKFNEYLLLSGRMPLEDDFNTVFEMVELELKSDFGLDRAMRDGEVCEGCLSGGTHAEWCIFQLNDGKPSISPPPDCPQCSKPMQFIDGAWDCSDCEQDTPIEVVYVPKSQWPKSVLHGFGFVLCSRCQDVITQTQAMEEDADGRLIHYKCKILKEIGK